VPLSEDVPQLLRTCWRSARPPRWLFAGRRDASRPIDTGSARAGTTSRATRPASPRVGLHSLRYACATHLLEAGCLTNQPSLDARNWTLFVAMTVRLRDRGDPILFGRWLIR